MAKTTNDAPTAAHTTQNEKLDHDAVGVAEARFAELTKLAGPAVRKLNDRTGRLLESHTEVGVLVYRVIDGEGLGEVLGFPIQTTVRDGKVVGATGLDRRWGIDGSVIRSLRDLGGLHLLAEEHGLTAPTAYTAAKKLCDALPADPETGEQRRGRDRFDNDDTLARLQAFSAAVADAKEKDPSGKVSEMRLAQQVREKLPSKSRAKSDNAEGSPLAEVTDLIEKLTAALKGVTWGDDGKLTKEAVAAFKARGFVGVTAKTINGVRAWTRTAS